MAAAVVTALAILVLLGSLVGMPIGALFVWMCNRKRLGDRRVTITIKGPAAKYLPGPPWQQGIIVGTGMTMLSVVGFLGALVVLL